MHSYQELLSFLEVFKIVADVIAAVPSHLDSIVTPPSPELRIIEPPLFLSGVYSALLTWSIAVLEYAVAVGF